VSARCGRTDLLVEQCAHCRPRADSPPPIDGVRLGGAFIARYPGRCALCPRRIDVGDWIAPALDEDDDADGYVCAHCIAGEGA
jgi:hypothetical protein